MYLNGIGTKKNVGLAIQYLEIALEGEYVEAAAILYHIYLAYPEHAHKVKTLRLKEFMQNDSKNINMKLMVITTYYENYSFSVLIDKCHKMMELISDLLYISELDMWHELGYKQYRLGRYSKALVTFSLSAVAGHAPSMLAVASKIYSFLFCVFIELWEENKTEHLK